MAFKLFSVSGSCTRPRPIPDLSGTTGLKSCSEGTRGRLVRGSSSKSGLGNWPDPGLGNWPAADSGGFAIREEDDVVEEALGIESLPVMPEVST